MDFINFLFFPLLYTLIHLYTVHVRKWTVLQQLIRIIIFILIQCDQN